MPNLEKNLVLEKESTATYMKKYLRKQSNFRYFTIAKWQNLQKIHAKLPNEHSLLTLIETFNVFAYLLNNQCIFKIGNETC